MAKSPDNLIARANGSWDWVQLELLLELVPQEPKASRTLCVNGPADKAGAKNTDVQATTRRTTRIQTPLKKTKNGELSATVSYFRVNCKWCFLCFSKKKQKVIAGQ